MSLSRKDSPTGHSKPQLKPGTVESKPTVINGTQLQKVSEIFKTMSSLARSMEAPWLSSPPYSDDPGRTEEFANQIHPKSWLDTGTFHGSSLRYCCKGHEDDLNPNGQTDLNQAAVAGLAMTVNGERVGITSYQRSSISQYMFLSRQYAPLEEELMHEYTDLPESRRNFSKLTVANGLKIDGYEHLVKCPPNIEPTAYHQPFVYVLLALVQELKLTFPELISITAALDYCPQTTLPCLLALPLFLADEETKTLRGFKVGLKFAELLCQLYEDLPEGGKCLRYSKRKKIHLRREQFYIHCHDKMHVCLRVWKSHPRAPTMKYRDSVYKKILGRVCRGVKDFQELGGKHSLIVLSCVGALPSWVREHSLLTGRTLKWLIDAYGLSYNGLDQEGKQILGTTSFFLDREMPNEQWSFAKTEMWLCKFFRIHNKSDTRYFDCHDIRAPIFSFNSNQIIVTTDQSKVLPQGVLCTHFQLKRRMRTLSDICDVLDIPEAFDLSKDFEVLRVSEHEDLWLDKEAQDNSSSIYELPKFWD